MNHHHLYTANSAILGKRETVMSGNSSPNIFSDEQRKYITQPSYVRSHNIVLYHQYREIRLDLDAKSKELLSEESLKDFYHAKVKMFTNTGRELEVQEEPESIFQAHQSDLSTCTDPEIKLFRGIK